MKVLVTGGTGLLGSAVRDVSVAEKWEGEYVFASSKDANLEDWDQTWALFQRHRPTHVVHLAACVGGMFANQAHNRDFFLSNMKINTNVLEACRLEGVTKVVSCLSTCVFPDGAPLPLEPRDMHNGPPHPSNEGYAYAKRMLEVLSRMYSAETGNPYICVVPTNMYGRYDNFDMAKAHVVPALIHKARLSHPSPLAVCGTGTPLRQFLYAPDAARMIGHVLRQYKDHATPVVLTSREEVSIAHVAGLIAAEFGIGVRVDGTPTADGQFKRTASAAGFLALVPEFEFTPLALGIRETVQWFRDNYATARVCCS